ncbi:gliding motility lipoprotein GldB [Oceanihabitans sediminis]|uniref:Gliding motility lipoprotein GldB n=1 Tax=Oceanihabitans sediminis TaxID=1812012 RepID=A0A368P823_9FLAO|nr:gliding motility lipoprotein GldB [Oceanihabitans sediminis]MDX1278352.1 gliding motility lipoprotein GldB [Oceanihabitans sediminis]MDX1772604.1 gliding motility lipoprotein GldB [Oceanihabitans sediminis]RBP34271.1 protein involved in gliding motility GldB [Oceanihabitans sediminis]RCU57959.1 gliding motility lipoprotein GldB [Oceanihabitans sediminis]
MKNIFLFLFITVLFVSCKQDSKLEKEISKIEMSATIERFDLAFANAKPSQLQELKDAFPFMFSKKYADSFWIAKMQDTIQIELNKEVKKVFPDLNLVEGEVKSLFQHIKYYFPEFKTPRLVSATSFVDYRNKVIVTDTISLIAIDTYLGSDHHFYEGIQKYISRTFTQDNIVIDLASEYAQAYIFPKKNKTFLDEMIYFGKQLYFKDLMIPFKTDAERIGYAQEQLDWAKTNEAQIWAYFVERELLYSTDPNLLNRFINPAPFSKFQLVEIDRESPGRIGQYIGWQIVKAYMENNSVSLKEMLIKDAEEIFNKSRFKPEL